MQASQTCYDFIKKQEGYEPVAKPCPAGVPTVGWGTIRWDLKTPVKLGETITPEEAEVQLRKEVQRVEDAVNVAVKVPLTQPEFDALISLGYNIGTAWITGQGHKQATLVKLLNQGKYNAVPAQLMLFDKDIHGKVWDGLETRRKWEAKMWLSDDHAPIVAATPQNEPGVMPQAVKPSAGDTALNTVKRSWTITGAFTGLMATAAHWVDNATGWSKATAQGVLDVQNDLNPVTTLGGIFLKNAEHITLAVAVIAFVIVMARRFESGFSGKVG